VSTSRTTPNPFQEHDFPNDSRVLSQSGHALTAALAHVITRSGTAISACMPNKLLTESSSRIRGPKTAPDNERLQRRVSRRSRWLQGRKGQDDTATSRLNFRSAMHARPTRERNGTPTPRPCSPPPMTPGPFQRPVALPCAGREPRSGMRAS
jgi:hypothetical protein